MRGTVKKCVVIVSGFVEREARAQLGSTAPVSYGRKK
jgi:hypothetical protein